MLAMGFNIVDGIAQGASLKNLLLYGMLLWYGKEISQGKAAATRQIRSVHRTFYAMAAWAVFSTLVAFALGVSSYQLVEAVLVWKNEFVDVLGMLLVTGMVIRDQNVAFLMLRILLFGVAAFASLTIIEAVVPSVHFFGLDMDSGAMGATGRLKGPFGEPNQTAAVLVMLLPIAFSLAVPRGSFRSGYLACGIVLMTTIMVTGSRGGVAGAAAGSLVLMFLLRKSIGMGGKVAILLAAPLLAILAWAIVPTATQEMIQTRMGALTDSSVDVTAASGGRTMIWENGVEFWLRQPVSGIGWTGFRKAFHGATHNEFLRYLVETGVVGLFLFLFLWRKVFACLSLPQDPGAKVSFVRAGAIAGVSGLLVSIFFVNLYKPWLIVWCVIGVLMCYLSYEHMAHLRRVERARSEQQDAENEQEGHVSDTAALAMK
jgi:O-antigen ligase